MNLLKHITFTLLGIVLATQCGSAFAVKYGQYYDKLWKVQIGQNSHLLVNVLGNLSTSHGCASSYFARSENDLNDAKTRALFDLARTAFETRQCVHVTTNGCTTSGLPILVQLQVESRDPTTGDCPDSLQQPPEPPIEPACPNNYKCCGGVIDGVCMGTCIPSQHICE